MFYSSRARIQWSTIWLTTARGCTLFPLPNITHLVTKVQKLIVSCVGTYTASTWSTKHNPTQQHLIVLQASCASLVFQSVSTNNPYNRRVNALLSNQIARSISSPFTLQRWPFTSQCQCICIPTKLYIYTKLVGTDQILVQFRGLILDRIPLRAWWCDPRTPRRSILCLCLGVVFVFVLAPFCVFAFVFIFVRVVCLYFRTSSRAS